MDSNSIDLIYLDPPFNTGRQWANPIKAKGPKAIASFEDTWKLDEIHVDECYALAMQYPKAADVIDTLQRINGDSWKAYLIYMGVRLAEMRRILKDSGSIYFHCDPVMSHGVKLLMDSIFGGKNFRNEIIWRIGWVSGYKTQKRGWIRNHDTLLYYVKSDSARELFNKEYIPYPNDYVRRDGKKPTGKGFPIEDTWNCHIGDSLDSIMIKSFSKEKTGYPTQKPLALLERIIKASSNEGGMILDPFCGCATTCIVAEKLARQWIGIDLSDNAADIIYDRLSKIADLPLTNPKEAVNRIDVKNRNDLPKRTDLPKIDYADIRPKLYSNQGKKCAGCEKEFTDPRLLEVDHIIARSRGGQDVEGNLQLLCGPCNKDKGGEGMEALRRKVQMRLLKEQMEESRRKWEGNRKAVA